MPEVTALLVFAGSLLSLTFVGDLFCYAVLVIPRPWMCRTSHSLSQWAYGLAQILAMLRLPFALLPYAGKLIMFLLLRTHFESIWTHPVLQAVRLFGDFLNVPLTLSAFMLISGMTLIPVWLMIAALIEIIRLAAEKGSMLFSALWQHLPHRRLARVLHYGNYYACSDEDRLTILYRVLERCAASDQESARKLAYFHAFRVVPDRFSLRTGIVRDVATGEIFIHCAWLNDPWLLIGQALRRAPWTFDPRFLRRPFYYRRAANPAATRFVLQHTALTPPYAWYQFGHEIKAGRFTWFFRFVRRFDRMREQPVRADGSYEFDPLLHWLDRAHADRSARPLWIDDEVIARHAAGPLPTTLELAERYTYPLKYVDEVLYPRLLQLRAEASAAATDSGASHCG